MHVCVHQASPYTCHGPFDIEQFCDLHDVLQTASICHDATVARHCAVSKGRGGGLRERPGEFFCQNIRMIPYHSVQVALKSVAAVQMNTAANQGDGKRRKGMENVSSKENVLPISLPESMANQAAAKGTRLQAPDECIMSPTNKTEAGVTARVSDNMPALVYIDTSAAARAAHVLDVRRTLIRCLLVDVCNDSSSTHMYHAALIIC